MTSPPLSVRYPLFVRLSTPPKDAMDVYVMGKKWMWKFAYQGGPSSLDVLRVPAGRPVRLEIVDGDDGRAYAWLGITRIDRFVSVSNMPRSMQFSREPSQAVNGSSPFMLPVPPSMPVTSASVSTRTRGLFLRRRRLISRQQVGWHSLGK